MNRPDVENILRRDLYIINRLLKLARGHVENFLYLSVMNVISDFNSRIYDEVDYRKEASNAQRIRKNLKGRENSLTLSSLNFSTPVGMVFPAMTSAPEAVALWSHRRF